jgi:hypothetical protein
MCEDLLGLTNYPTGRRSLGVNLLYNPTCPLLYEPSGFAGSPDTNHFPFIDTATPTDDVGKFQVGYYEIAVAASHAKLVEEETGRQKVPESINDGDSARNPTSSYLKDLTTRRQLQAMQRSSSIPSNLISTQMERALKRTQTASQSALSAATPPERDSSIGVDWSSLRQRNITPTKMAELIVQAWGLEAHNQSFTYVLDMDQLRKNNKIKRLNPGKDVSCECGSYHKEDEMVC